MNADPAVLEYEPDHFGEARRTRRYYYLRALWSGAFARAINMVIQVLTVALTVRYLGGERYGMWATLSSIAGWLGLANFGLGNGLTTRLSEHHGRSNRDGAATAVSSTFVIISVISFLCLVLLAGPAVMAPWAKIFNVHSPLAIAEARPTVLVLLFLILCMLPLSIGGAILAGHQRTDLANFATAFMSIVGIACLWVGTRRGWGLPALAAILLAPPVLADLIHCIIARRLGLAPISLSRVNAKEAWSMLRLGAKFLFLQFLTIALFQTGALIIAARFGATNVTPYAVTNRLVMVAITCISVVLTPLTPAYGEAFARGDLPWARRALMKSVTALFVLWIPVCGFLILFGRPIIRVWAGPAAVPDYPLLLSMLGFTLGFGLSAVVAIFLNGIGRLSSQICSGVVMAFLHIPLSLWLAGRIGIAGVALSQTLLMFAISVPATYLHAFRELSKAPAATSPPPSSTP